MNEKIIKNILITRRGEEIFFIDETHTKSHDLRTQDTENKRYGNFALSHKHPKRDNKSYRTGQVKEIP